MPGSKVNQAMRIDTRLVDPLENLPPAPSAGRRRPSTSGGNLAFRNLTRAKMCRLATGQQMVAHLRSRGVEVTTLTKAQILNGKAGPLGLARPRPSTTRSLTNTPLWFYLLREAELNNGKVKGVGGRIVAETFHRAMEGSQHLDRPRPDLAADTRPGQHTFRMVDLLLFAFKGKKSLLAPLG